jgi:hypothetical protein
MTDLYQLTMMQGYYAYNKTDQIAVFEEQKDLISLAAGETYRNLWTIEVK